MKRIIFLLFCALLVPVIVLLSSCGSSQETADPFQIKQHTADRIDADETAALREEYPQIPTDDGMSLACYAGDQEKLSLEEWFSQESASDIAVVHIVSSWYSETSGKKATDDEELNDDLENAEPDLTHMMYPVVDAVVDAVIWSESGNLAKGEQITLHFGYVGTVESQGIGRIIKKGNTYVILMHERAGHSSIKTQNLYSTTKSFILYLTAEQVLLSSADEGASLQADGLYLDRFIEQVQTYRSS